MSILTVSFDDPWWVGVIEVEKDGVLLPSGMYLAVSQAIRKYLTLSYSIPLH